MATEWIFDQDGEYDRVSCTRSTSWQRRVSRDSVGRPAISATTRSQGSFGSSTIRTRPLRCLNGGGLLANTVQGVVMVEKVCREGLQLQVA